MKDKQDLGKLIDIINFYDEEIKKLEEEIRDIETESQSYLLKIKPTQSERNSLGEITKRKIDQYSSMIREYQSFVVKLYTSFPELTK